jgi:hypothetical protein
MVSATRPAAAITRREVLHQTRFRFVFFLSGKIYKMLHAYHTCPHCDLVMSLCLWWKNFQGEGRVAQRATSRFMIIPQTNTYTKETSLCGGWQTRHPPSQLGAEWAFKIKNTNIQSGFNLPWLVVSISQCGVSSHNK